MSDPSHGKTREIDPCLSKKTTLVDLVTGLEGFTGFVAGATAPANPVNPFKPVPVRGGAFCGGNTHSGHSKRPQRTLRVPQSEVGLSVYGQFNGAPCLSFGEVGNPAFE